MRGTTLRTSILRILDRLKMKKIIVVSSAPQIRYPDCYGIDMSKMGDFVAFEAAVSLAREQGLEKLLEEVYLAAKADLEKPVSESQNEVKRLYEALDTDAISARISQLLTPPDIEAEVEIIYQSIEGCIARPRNTKAIGTLRGLSYPGGNRVANRAYINFIESSNERAY